MPERTTPIRHTLGVDAARQIAVVTKTVPMMEQITPRWRTSMSANTMSTSDPRAAGALAPELAKGAGGAPRSGIVRATMASRPDPIVIAKLANELFVAFSGNPVPPAGALPSASPPVSAAGGPAVSVPETPQGAGLGPPVETDPGTLPASPTGAAALVPANPAAVPAQGAPGTPATAFDGARAPFLNATPVFPARGELFSLPSVPEVQSPPVLPSLPSPPSPTQPTEAELRALPASLGDATMLVPEPAGAEATAAAPGSSPYFVDVKGAAPVAAPPAFPLPGDLFSFPELPGAQSVPADPARPSAPTTTLPTEADLRAQTSSPPGATAPVPELTRAVPPAPTPSSYLHESDKAAAFLAISELHRTRSAARLQAPWHL
jgi:ribonuclease E